MAAKKKRSKAKGAKAPVGSPSGALRPAPLPPYSRPVEPLPEPLTEEQRQGILDLLPLSDPKSADAAIEAIELNRCFFHGIHSAGWKRTREWRDARAAELEELAGLSKRLASYLAQMTLDARVQAAAVKLVDGGPHEQTFALRTEDGEMPAIPRRGVFPVVYDGAGLISEWAAEAAAGLRAPMRKGRQPEFPPRVLAGGLADLWLQSTNESLAPKQDRENDTHDWPFLDFVRAVGRTVDPEFDGYRAVRSTHESRLKLAQR